MKKMRPIRIGGADMNNPMGFNERTAINDYLNMANKFPPFSREEEIEAVKAAKGNPQFFENFVNHNLLLVVAIAKRHMHLGLPLEDLVQFGNLGLMKSARLYVEHEEYYMKNRFNTFAVWYIRKAITDAVEEYGTTVRYTHDNNVTYGKILKAVETFERRNGRKPTAAELAELTGESEKKIATVVGLRMKGISTETVLEENDNSSVTFGDTLAGSFNADDIVEESEKKSTVNRALGLLGQRERVVVKMAFGIGYDYEHDAETISGKLGISVDKVYKIISKSMKTMREAAASLE